MSQVRNAFFGAAALAVTLGAVQLASGHDLTGGWQSGDGPRNVVNRTGKADRIADRRPGSVPTRTVSLRLNDLAGTSVLIRVPVAQARSPSAPMILKSPRHKSTVACEPVVSVLTEVAKLLQPGRCVT